MKSICSVFAVFLCYFNVHAQFNCVRGNCQDQHSVAVYQSGNRYEGDFQAGMPHGLGVMAFRNGDQYIGDFRRQYRHGKGRLRFQNGDEYFGSFVENKMQGYGEMTYVDGNTYKGDWFADAPHGSGIFAFRSGDRYEGQFSSGMFHGNGKMFYSDGSIYDGQWQFNQRHGRGQMIGGVGAAESGWWEEDAFVSKDKPVGARDLTDADTAYLRNCNLEFCLAGRGSFTYRNGTHYVGDFQKGIPEGQGKVYYNNGDKYEGGWIQHVPHGSGTMYYKSGQTVKAVWEKGRPGHIIREDGPRESPNNAKDSPNGVQIWAVVVGAAQYLHMPALRYTDDDAYQLYAFLKSPQGGAVSDRQLRLLIDEDATRAGILNAIQQVFSQADDNDVIIFYFSGHGVEGAFLPIDFDGINNRILHDDLKKAIAKSPAKHKIVVADACHSGSIFFQRSSTQQILQRYYAAFEQTNGGMALLMSSKGEEYSLEDSGLRSGVFSHFFIKGLKGAADNDSSGIISVNEIFQYVYRNVRMYTGNIQTPLLLGSFDKRMPIGAVH